MYSSSFLDKEDCTQHALLHCVCMSVMWDSIASCIYLQTTLETHFLLLHKTETVVVKTALNYNCLKLK